MEPRRVQLQNPRTLLVKPILISASSATVGLLLLLWGSTQNGLKFTDVLAWGLLFGGVASLLIELLVIRPWSLIVDENRLTLKRKGETVSVELAEVQSAMLVRPTEYQTENRGSAAHPHALTVNTPRLRIFSNNPTRWYADADVKAVMRDTFIEVPVTDLRIDRELYAALDSVGIPMLPTAKA